MNTTQSAVSEPGFWVPADSNITSYSVYTAAFALLIYYALFRRSSYHPARGAPKQWTAYHWPMIGSSMHYFARRRDMFLNGRNIFPSGCFSFFVRKKHIIALSGAQARQVFFETRGLSLAQG